jgi:hypothetical protein
LWTSEGLPERKPEQLRQIWKWDHGTRDKRVIQAKWSLKREGGPETCLLGKRRKIPEGGVCRKANCTSEVQMNRETAIGTRQELWIQLGLRVHMS